MMLKKEHDCITNSDVNDNLKICSFFSSSLVLLKTKKNMHDALVVQQWFHTVPSILLPKRRSRALFQNENQTVQKQWKQY